MPFAVRGKSPRLAVGDSIGAQLVVTQSDSWLQEVRVVRGAPTVRAAPAVPFAPLRPGEPLSDFQLVDQDGRPVRLEDLRGKTAVVTFIYTRCPLPNYCPLMSQRFALLQRRILADARLREKVALITVSFDVAYDTPARLREYAKRTGADYRVWRFVTGKEQAVAVLATELGVLYAPDRGLINHNLETAVIDRDGKLVRRFSGSDWAADDLAAEVERVATGRGDATVRRAQSNIREGAAS